MAPCRWLFVPVRGSTLPETVRQMHHGQPEPPPAVVWSCQMLCSAYGPLVMCGRAIVGCVGCVVCVWLLSLSSLFVDGHGRDIMLA